MPNWTSFLCSTMVSTNASLAVISSLRGLALDTRDVVKLRRLDCVLQKFTNTKVPQYVWDKLEELKQDDEAVRKFGVEVGVQMGKELIESGTRILHWYTMNLEKSVIEIINKLGIVDA